MSSGTQCASGRSDSLRNVDGNIIFDVGDYGIYNNSGVWKKSDTTDSVPSVAGLTGPIGSAALTDALTDGATNHVFTAADFTKLG